MVAGRKEASAPASPMRSPKAGGGAPAARRTNLAVEPATSGRADPLVPGPVLAKLAHRHPEVARALQELAASGKVTGTRAGKISARVDPGVFAAAAQRFGLQESQVSEVVNASLAVAAAPDKFKEWFRAERDRIPDDFELAI